MRNILLLTRNTLKLMLRKKSNIFLMLLSILIPLIFLAFSFADNSSQLRIGIINKDSSVISSDLIKSLKNSDKFKIVPLTESNANDEVVKGEVDCAIFIPEGYGDSIISNKVLNLQIVSIKGEDATALIKSYINIYVRNLIDMSKAANGNKDTFNKIYADYKNLSFNLKTNLVKDKSHNNIATMRSLGFFIMFLMMSTGSIAELMLQEKRDKTFYRVCAAPVSPKTYIFSNFIVNTLVMIFQIVVILLLLTWFLKLNFSISLFQIFIVLLCFGIVSIGLGMVIIAFSDSTAQSSTLTTLIVTPTCMLGGVFWPIDLMPKILQRISDFMPQKWAIDAINKLQAGAGFNQVWVNIAILLAFAAVFLLIASYKIKTSEKTADFV